MFLDPIITSPLSWLSGQKGLKLEGRRMLNEKLVVPVFFVNPDGPSCWSPPDPVHRLSAEADGLVSVPTAQGECHLVNCVLSHGLTILA